MEPDQCTLTHPIDNEDLSSLTIQSWAGEDTNQVLIAANSLPFSPSNELFETSVTFRPDRPERRQLARASRLQGNDEKIFMMSGADNGLLDAIAHSSEITIKKGAKQIGPINLANSQQAIAAFQKCLNDQLIAWGANPAQFQVGGQPPVAIVDRDDFIPNQTLLRLAFNGENLEARFKIGIGLGGDIDNCERIDEKSTDNVEKTICDSVIKRNLFSPAKSPTGAAVNGIATFRVVILKRSR